MFTCRVCEQSTNEFLDLGDQPAANRFKENKEDLEEKYRLKVAFCPSCYTIQIKDYPDIRKVYDETYPFLTSSSNYMVKHFKNLADMIKNKYSPQDFFIVEIGSNDGSFLSNFKDVSHLGIEPSRNVNDFAFSKGLTTWNTFFNEVISEAITEQMGQVQIVVSTNVFAHIPQRLSFLRGIKKLLRRNGVWINEEAYIGNILERVSYDQFYNEHIFYSSIVSFKNILDKYNLEIFDVEFHNVHGGSIRYFVKNKGSNVPWYSKNIDKVNYLIEVENLYSFDRLKLFAFQVERSKHKFLSQLHMIKSWGGTIVGYGATAKSTTILNYCGINSSLIEKIYDTTINKHYKYSPGTDIQIVPYETFKQDSPRNVVLFAWNHMAEIYEKEKDCNINWIIPIGI